MTGTEEFQALLGLDVFTTAERSALKDPTVQTFVIQALDNRRHVPTGSEPVSSYIRSEFTADSSKSLDPALLAALKKIDMRVRAAHIPLV